MARLPLIAGNWKMNKTVEEAVDLARQLKSATVGVEGVEVAIAPLLRPSMPSRRSFRVRSFAWQPRMCSGKKRGRLQERSLRSCSGRSAATTSSSATRRGVSFSERRRDGEPQAEGCSGQGMRPIFCIGETLQEREGGKAFAVMERQVEGDCGASRRASWRRSSSPMSPSGPSGRERRLPRSRPRRSIDLSVRSLRRFALTASQKIPGSSMEEVSLRKT